MFSEDRAHWDTFNSQTGVVEIVYRKTGDSVPFPLRAALGAMVGTRVP